MHGLYVGTQAYDCVGKAIVSTSPIDGSILSTFSSAQTKDVNVAVHSSLSAFNEWRQVPAPQRGQLVRHMAALFRQNKEQLADIIVLEMGKIKQEALGEVQEVIDICDFAVGLSRQLHGLNIACERPQHRLAEQWHPLGPVGVITAFNFPMAVWAWNATLAFVCGDSVVWKPSEKTPLCAKACHNIVLMASKACDFDVPDALHVVINGFQDVGAELVADRRVALVSATGSTKMGKSVATAVASRLGRSLLELGGNAAMIVAKSADVDLAVKAAVFSAIGTCGQRCTSLRRLIIHEDLYDEVTARLKAAYGQVVVGDPRRDAVHVGPIIDKAALDAMERKIAEAGMQGGKFLCQAPDASVPASGTYVLPIVVEVPDHLPVMDEETFAPLLYVMKYSKLSEAIALNNRVAQGLGSSIITNDVNEAELFCSAVGSDCGLANVNLGTTGAEIGGAFGGEKETGGGREAGSDAWKVYMRRQTNTVNYSGRIHLAQGIKFEV